LLQKTNVSFKRSPFAIELHAYYNFYIIAHMWYKSQVSSGVIGGIIKHMKKPFKKLGNWMRSHKIASSLIIIIIIVGGYYGVKKAFAAPSVPQYTLSPVRRGNITQTVTGSGQVSAENQLDVTSEVSAKVTSIKVSVGQHVKAGDLLATLDTKDALVSLQNAQIAYEKITKPADPGDLTTAQNNLSKAYSDGYTAIASVFLHFPSVMGGLKDMLYSRTGYLSDGQASTMSETGRNYRFQAAADYESMSISYNALLEMYRGLSKDSSSTQIQAMLGNTATLEKQLVETLKAVQTAYNFISTSQPDYNPSGATSAGASITSWSNQAASDLSGVISASNTITNNKESLDKLQEGADTLDVKSQQISLDQAQKNYEKYFIRAPFEGIVGRIPVSLYSTAGGSTVIATIVGDQKRAVISLNEVDAAKVAAGQKVTITFDAIDGLNATGTVQEVDQVGTVSQGVVSYGVKILIDTTDPRIKPGMSVNTAIITAQKENVLVVPTAAVKTQGNRKYVQVLDTQMNTNGMASTTRPFYRMGTTTGMGSTTRQFNGGGANSNGFTVSSATPPRQVTVTVGDSDDTNTEITSGLNPGQLVVTRTVAASATTSTAPSIIGAFGGNRGGVRTGGGAAPAGGANRAITR
jgi:HlyD family secretion protein